MERLTGLLGMAVFILLAMALSRRRKDIHWKTVGWALVLQWLFAVVVLKGTVLAQALSFLPWPGVRVYGVYVGLGWVVLLLLLTPMLLGRFLGYRNRTLNWVLFGLATYGMLWGNLVGKSFDRMRIVVEHLMAFAKDGATFVFGPLANPNGSVGLVFAFVVLPTIIFVASIFAVLYHLGVMQWIVGAFARAMGRFLKISGAESVSVSVSIR